MVKCFKNNPNMPAKKKKKKKLLIEAIILEY